MPRLRAHAIQPPKPSQRGAAFMIMLVIMIIGAVTVFVSSLNSSALQIARDGISSDALAQAKEALVGRAVASAARPGSLPCPDTTNSGFADTIVAGNCPSYIGRLPWQTLGLPDLRDGAGERLWYALSPNFRDDSSNPVNSNNRSALQVYDNSGTALLTPAGSEAIAIIFAPGSIVGTQQRDAANQNNAQNYLDAGPNGKYNYTAAGPFVAAGMSSTYNDRLLIIRASDVMPLVETRVAKELVASFAAYAPANGAYPHPSNFNNCTSASCLTDITQCIGKVPITDMAAYLPSWFTSNNWFDVIYYTAGTNALPGGSGAAGNSGKKGWGKGGKVGGGLSNGGGTPPTGSGTGCYAATLSVGYTSGVNALLLMPGTPLGAITRTYMTTANLTDYFEDTPDNTDLNDAYVIPGTINSSSNDSLYILP